MVSLKWHPVHDMQKHTIDAMRFQGTPLGGGYSMGEGIVVGWLGRGYRSTMGGGCAWASDTQFSVVGVIDF